MVKTGKLPLKYCCLIVFEKVSRTFGLVLAKPKLGINIVNGGLLTIFP